MPSDKQVTEASKRISRNIKTIILHTQFLSWAAGYHADLLCEAFVAEGWQKIHLP